MLREAGPVTTDTAVAAGPAEGGGRAGQPAAPSDAISLILAQAGRSPEEIAALATLDDADRGAERQFSGEPPTLTTLFGRGRAVELAPGRFSPSAEVAATMAACSSPRTIGRGSSASRSPPSSV